MIIQQIIGSIVVQILSTIGFAVMFGGAYTLFRKVAKKRRG
jgi:hypothetical protein